MSKLFLKLVKLKQSCGKEFHTLFTYLITSFNFQCLSQFHLMSSAFVQKEAMKKKNKTYPYLFLGSLFLADLYLTFCLPSRLKILSLIIYYLKTVSYLCLSILLPFFFLSSDLLHFYIPSEERDKNYGMLQTQMHHTPIQRHQDVFFLVFNSFPNNT